MLQQQVTATSCSDKSLRVCWKIFAKIFVAATEFCRRNESHKIKSDWISATCYGDKILLCRQRFSQKFSSRHEAICCSNRSPDLYTRSGLSPRSVVVTCRLVYTDPTGSYITWVGSVKRGMSVLFTVELDPAVELGTWNRLHQPVSHNSSKLCGVRIKHKRSEVTLLYGAKGGLRVDTVFVFISKGPSRCWDIIWSFICLFSQLITVIKQTSLRIVT